MKEVLIGIGVMFGMSILLWVAEEFEVSVQEIPFVIFFLFLGGCLLTLFLYGIGSLTSLLLKVCCFN